MNLDGWGAIAARLSEHAGVEVSVHQAKRYRERARDPLPARRVGRTGRPRIVAEQGELDAWAQEEFGFSEVRDG